MAQRIVVSFRGTIDPVTQGARRYLERALAAKKRAEAHGAKLCAWSAQTFSFDFAVDELEEALSLATLAFDGDEPEDRFMVGISQGELSVVGDGGSFSALSWGPPLVAAVALAREARAGEVLIDPEVVLSRSAELDDLGHTVETDPQKRLNGLRVGALLPSPAKRDLTSVAILTKESEPPPVDDDEPAPPSIGRTTQKARRALTEGDVPSLERLVVDLRGAGAHPELAERLSGLLALQRGATADGLRMLRAAAETEQTPVQKARSRLAYGVALAAAGRNEDALFEALAALARAREAADAQGESACARLLARLSSASGHPAAASIWEKVAEQSASG